MNHVTPLVVGLFVIAAISSGCSNTTHVPTEDTTYLTPIPMETMEAYREGQPLTSKLQAAIAGQAGVNQSRLRSTIPARAVLAEKTSLSEAYKRVEQPGTYIYEERPGSTEVWFVLLEGKWQVTPPDPRLPVTPREPGLGCVFVILDAQEGRPFRVGGLVNCPSEEP